MKGRRVLTDPAAHRLVRHRIRLQTVLLAPGCPVKAPVQYTPDGVARQQLLEFSAPPEAVPAEQEAQGSGDFFVVVSDTSWRRHYA